MYKIYVKFECFPQKREAFVNAIKEEGILSAIRAEDGCLRYDFYFSEADENELLLIEAWETKNHQQIHMQQPHMVRMHEINKECIKESFLGEYELKN